MWLRPRFDGLLQRCLELDLDDQLPDPLAVMLLEGLKEIAQEELGDYAAHVGAVKFEQHRIPLGRALAKELDMREGLGGLGKDASGGWLSKVLRRALGLNVSDYPGVSVTVLARPLFEQAFADVFERVRATSSDTRTVVRQVLEAIELVATDAGLGSGSERVAALRGAAVPLEQAVKRALSTFQVSGATGAGWERHGIQELAMRAKSRNDWVSVPRAIWVGRREDAALLLDRLALAIGIGWSKLDKGSAAWSKKLGAAGVVKPYSPAAVFARGEALTHTKFGIGVVIGVEQGRIEVSFPDATRKLAHAG